MDASKQSNESFETFFNTQLRLWERWMEFVRQIEAATPANAQAAQERADALTRLNEQAQGAIDVNKAWAQLWIDSLEHSNAVMNAMVVSGNRRFDDYHTQAQQQLEMLAEQVEELTRQARILDVKQGWIRQWIENNDRNQGIVTAMMAWNQQIIERQAEARRQFLSSWFETFQNFSPFREVDHAPVQQSLAVLQEAITKAMSIPFGLPEPAVQQDEAVRSSAKQVKQTRVKTA